MKCYTFDGSSGSITLGIEVKNNNPLLLDYRMYISENVFLQLWKKNPPEIQDNRVFDAHPVRINPGLGKSSYFVLARPANKSNDILVLVKNADYLELQRYDDDLEPSVCPPEEIPTTFSISCPGKFSPEKFGGKEIAAFTHIIVLANKHYLYENGLLRIVNVEEWRKLPCKYTIFEDEIPKYVLSNSKERLKVSNVNISEETIY